MQKNISVLISVYEKENPIYFRKAINSIYKQTFLPEEIVLVVDGPIPSELEDVINENLKGAIPFNVVRLKENVSLGLALNEGLKQCKNELVARMDTDDIARPYRFEKQYTYMMNYEDCAVLGGNICEFIEEGKAIRTKTMPLLHEEIFKYAKLRNPINHMTVMYRKSCVLEVGGYRDKLYIEDYDLWTRLLVKGYKFINLNEVLVDARIGNDFSLRRGGDDYFDKYKEFRQCQKEIGFLNTFEYIKALSLTYAITKVPKDMRNLTYKQLRKKA